MTNMLDLFLMSAINPGFRVWLHFRPREEGALWSLTLANYIQNGESVGGHIVRLYDNVER